MTEVRRLVIEVLVDPDSGIDQASVVNGDGLHAVSQRGSTERLGSVPDDTLNEICEAIAMALGCDRR